MPYILTFDVLITTWRTCDTVWWERHKRLLFLGPEMTNGNRLIGKYNFCEGNTVVLAEYKPIWSTWETFFCLYNGDN